MEQNQNQTLPLISFPEISSEEEWERVRNEFASNQQSIGEAEKARTLIEKWIWINNQQEFKEYEMKLRERSANNRSINSLIAELIEQEKPESDIITQKYGLERVDKLIAKLRATIQEMLRAEQDLNPETNQEITSGKLELTYSRSPEVTTIKEKMIEKEGNCSIVLPEIKAKGKVYQPNEMPTPFQLLKQTEGDYIMRSPYMFARQEKGKQPSKSNLFNNKYLKKTFSWFCKQGYNSKGLFEDFSREADKMTLNKWMIFCKEFGFNEKFHKKDLISTFQSATKFASMMLIDDFLTAVALLQEKYVNKFHTGQQNFVTDVLQIGTEAAFRAKMDSLKVSYSGPRRNFFEYATYFEQERADEIQREKAFQAKKRQRELVLIKGMFEDHLKDQLKQLKVNRQNKSYKLNKSVNIAEINEKRKDELSPIKTHRLQELNYSKIFQINRENTGQKEPNSTSANTDFSDRKVYKTELAKQEAKPRKQEASQKKIEVEKKKLETRGSSRQNLPIIFSKNIEPEPEPELHLQENTWLTNIRTDSEQSDEILKQHLNFQKKTKGENESDRVGSLMKQQQERSLQVQKIKQQILHQNQQDEDLLQTQVNFRKDKEIFL